MSDLSDLVREFWLDSLADDEAMADVYRAVVDILDRQPPPPSGVAEAIVAYQRAKGLRTYGVTLEDALLSVAESAQHTAQELADVARYLMDFVRRARAVLPEDDAEHLSLLVLDVMHALDTVARYADPPPEELPPMVPTRDAVERWGYYWYRGKRVIPVALSAREDDAPWDYFTGRLIDPTDDWRGPVPRAPRGVR